MSPKKVLTSEEKVALILAAMEEKKAENPVVIDVRGRTVMTEFLVIASGTSRIQIRAIADAVIAKLADEGVKNKRVAGIQEGTWLLLDYGDVVIHVQAPEQREHYRLEAYWAGREPGSPPLLTPEE